MRNHLFAAAIAATGVLTVTGFAMAGSGGRASSSADCIGLNCVSAFSEDAVPEASGAVPSVSGPEQLAPQKTAGFYEFGRGTTSGKRAVAYVVPYGQLDRMPASVRDLPVVRAIEEPAGHRNDFDSGTVVIFEPDVSLFVPRSGTAAIAAGNHRAVAQASGEDAYGCRDYYFCLYACRDWYIGAPQCSRLQFATSQGNQWHNLGNYAFNDMAMSMRNRRNRDSLLARNSGGGSTRYCADSNSVDKTFSNNPIGEQEASSFLNLSTDGRC